MRRKIDGPSRVDRLSKNFIDHPPTPTSVDTLTETHVVLGSFPFSPELPGFQRYQISPSWNRARGARDRLKANVQDSPRNLVKGLARRAASPRLARSRAVLEIAVASI